MASGQSRAQAQHLWGVVYDEGLWAQRLDSSLVIHVGSMVSNTLILDVLVGKSDIGSKSARTRKVSSEFD
jgi:hypothetical protein